ncbi:MAG: esterase [Sandaracinaceae bacterium]
MKTRTLGALEARVLGGSDREGGGEGPVVVLFHGYGAPGDDLVGLYRGLDVDRSVRFVFPEAPHLLQGGFDFSAFGMGAPRAWWHIDLAALEEAIAAGSHRDLRHEVPAGLADARDRASSLLSAVRAQLHPSHVVVGGFSQGAMLATSLALETDVALDGLVCFSGTYLAEDVWKPRMATRAGLPVLLTHGTHDPLLPHALAEQLTADLRQAGVEAQLVTFRGQHQIPPVALTAFERFLRRVTSS